MHIHRAKITDIIESPDGFQQLIPVVDPARVGNEQVEQIKFLHRQVYGFAVGLNAPVPKVNGDVPRGDDHTGCIVLRACPPEDGFNPSLNF
ncbi:hypothetical protein SDC9_188874 [bioreactor metagenome]|uniref:Uncharacterized protein n=1 Tax=bioreactor metagenome TaxID=1076179 RepID=A0A645HQJ9_9ZZZZ